MKRGLNGFTRALLGCLFLGLFSASQASETASSSSILNELSSSSVSVEQNLGLSSSSIPAGASSSINASSSSPLSFSSSSQADSVHLIEKYRTKAIAAVAWPFEHVIQPTFNTLLYPLIPPAHYIFDQRVIERSINLITWGAKNQIMVYPTFKFQPGTSANSIGAAYRQQGIVSDSMNDNFFVIYNKYVNADWDIRSRYAFNKIGGTSLGTALDLRYKEDSDNGFTVMEFGNKNYPFADSSWGTGFSIYNPLVGKWAWAMSVGINRQRFNRPDILNDTVLPKITSPDSFSMFDQYERGMYQRYYEYPLGLQLSYNSRESTHAATDGQFLRLNWNYTVVSKYQEPYEGSQLNNNLNHDYYVFQGVYQTYFLLGKQQYALTRDESKANQRYLENISFQQAVSLLSPEQLHETLLERKVLAIQLRFYQMMESDPGGAPFTGYGTINSNMPLRGYNQSFAGKNFYSISTEYRWPLVDLVDGVVFNEYALYGDSWQNPQIKNLRNSWGFGIRVRLPEQFLTRLQFGFHGTQGICMILTVNPEFQ